MYLYEWKIVFIFPAEEFDLGQAWGIGATRAMALIRLLHRTEENTG